MPKLARISLRLLSAWAFINLAPALLCSLPKRATLADVAFGLYSGQAWYWDVVNGDWLPPALPLFVLLIRCLLLFFPLMAWLRKPTIIRASLLIAVGPWVAPVWLGPLVFLAALASVCAILGGLLVRCWWEDSARPQDPSAPMPTWHH